MEKTAPALGTELPTAVPALVVSDLDGTLLTTADRISPRTCEVIGRVVNSGTRFIPASGRPARWMLPAIEQLGIRPMCVCANGAVVYDSATDRITYAAELAPDVLQRVVDAVWEATSVEFAQRGVGPVSFAVERVGRSAYDRAEELFAVEPGFPHAWETTEHATEERDLLLSRPAVKLLVRHDAVTSAELFDVINPVVDPADAHVTWSFHGGLLEINVPGVSKLSGVAHALNHVSGRDIPVAAGPIEPQIDPARVIAFGDMPNDMAILQWAGCGIAMENAVEEVAEVADYRTLSNDEDGVATVLEHWF